MHALYVRKNSLRLDARLHVGRSTSAPSIPRFIGLSSSRLSGSSVLLRSSFLSVFLFGIFLSRQRLCCYVMCFRRASPRITTDMMMLILDEVGDENADARYRPKTSFLATSQAAFLARSGLVGEALAAAWTG